MTPDKQQNLLLLQRVTWPQIPGLDSKPNGEKISSQFMQLTNTRMELLTKLGSENLAVDDPCVKKLRDKIEALASPSMGIQAAHTADDHIAAVLTAKQKISTLSSLSTSLLGKPNGFTTPHHRA